MANVPESPVYEAGIYQIEVTDPVLGGTNGISNLQAKQLANRTAYLKQQVDNLSSGLGDASDRLDQLEDDHQAQENWLRDITGAGLPRHCVVTSKHQTGSSSWIPDYFNGSTINASGTVRIAASATEPFIATISGGFDSRPITRYVRLTSNLDTPYTGTSIRWVVLNISVANVLSVLLEAKQDYTIAYVAPTSPVNGDYWYSLRDERMYKRVSGAWSAVNSVIIGWFDPVNEEINYVGTVGRSIMSLYGRGFVPAGTVHTFAGAVASIPDGYLLCNGGAISRTIYSDLFRAIGTTYGVGDGSTTFNIPDLRGEFLRGLDNGRGVDPARALGSAQADELRSHTHGPGSGTWFVNLISGSGTEAIGSGGSDYVTASTTASTGGSETRPRNVAMNFIIKF